MIDPTETTMVVTRTETKEGPVQSRKSPMGLRRGAAALVLAFALFGLPNGPGTQFVPTVGGEALAYAPCYAEAAAVDAAWDALGSATGAAAIWAAIQVYYDAVAAYASCRFG